MLANLDSEAHPELRFRSTGLTAQDGALAVVGDFTVQGNTARVGGTAKPTLADGRLSATADLVLGVRNLFPELPPSWAVEGDIHVQVDLEARR